MSQAAAPCAAAAGWNSLLSAAAAVAQPSSDVQTAAALTAASTAGSAPAPFQRLHRDGLQSVFTFLSSDDLWSSRRVCAAWISAARAEHRRRLIALQLEAVTLISTNAAAGSAWKELCTASDSPPSLQSNVLSMLLRLVSGPPPCAESTPPHASDSQLAAAHKLLSALASSVVLRADLLATFGRLLYAADNEVLTAALRAFAALTATTDDDAPPHSQIQSFIECGLSRRVVELLMHRAPPVKSAALTVVIHICRGSDLQKQALLDCSVLLCLLSLLVHPKKAIRRDSCVALASICAGSVEQIELAISANLIPPLVSILRHEEWDIQKEAARAISNALRGGSDAQIRYVVAQGAIPPLCELLTCPNEEIILVALEGIEHILRVGKADAAAGPLASNAYADMVDQCRGLDYLGELQEHESEAIYSKAVSILDTYFIHGDDDYPEGGPDAAQMEDGAQYTFAHSGGFQFGQ